MAQVDGLDAGIELITAMMAAMNAEEELTDLLGGTDKIFDRVPTDESTQAVLVEYPYISLGPSTMIPDDAECMQGEEISIQWDIWTSGSGEAYASVQCRKITNIVKRILHDAELALTVNALVTLQCELVRILDDPNPAIRHGVVSLLGTVETP